MCGRFSATFTFQRDQDSLESPERSLIRAALQYRAVAIGAGDRERRAWQRGEAYEMGPRAVLGARPSIGNRMINARAETLLEKPSFRNLVSQRRCLIPADGFMNGVVKAIGKSQCGFTFKKKEPFAFAGLWDSWRNVELGDVLNTFTIITTDPNALVRPIHNRMPVIYDREMGKQWLEQRAYSPSLEQLAKSQLPLL